MITNVSPNVDLYTVFKGIVKIKIVGAGSFRDVGNVPAFTTTPTITPLDHFSSRQGVRFKDKSVTQEKSMQLRMTMEEVSADNLAIVLAGNLSLGSPIAQSPISILVNDSVTGWVRLIGTNSVGVKCQVDLPSVTFRPSGDMPWISDTWAGMEVTGEINGDTATGSFGQVLWDTDGTEVQVTSPYGP